MAKVYCCKTLKGRIWRILLQLVFKKAEEKAECHLVCRSPCEHKYIEHSATVSNTPKPIGIFIINNPYLILAGHSFIPCLFMIQRWSKGAQECCAAGGEFFF
mgnify:CR=1 FL=1